MSKFSYLKGALQGSAYVAIPGISVTEDNYDVVVALLKDKFGSKESIIKTLYASPGKMADTVPRTLEPVNIDFLIGSDYFWNILGTEKVRFIFGVIQDRLYPYRKIYRSRSCRAKCFDLFCDITSKLLGLLGEFVFF